MSTPARPSAEEIAELIRQLRDNKGHGHAGGCQGCFSMIMDTAADLLALVTKEGGDPVAVPMIDVDSVIREVAELPDRTSPSDRPDMMLVSADELQAILLAHAIDIAPPARSENAPARATTLIEDEPDTQEARMRYRAMEIALRYRDGETSVLARGTADAIAIQIEELPLSPVTVPEGMETTAEMRADIGHLCKRVAYGTAMQLIRDLDRALAEIDRLTAALAEARQRSASEYSALQAKSVREGIEREQQAREEERERIAAKFEGMPWHQARARSTP